MVKVRLTLVICLYIGFGPLLQATEFDVLENDPIVSAIASSPKVKLSAQPYSLKDIPNFHIPGLVEPSINTLSVSKTWSDDSEWKLFSTHHIRGQSEYSSPSLDTVPALSLGQGTSGFSMNNRLSLRKRFSNSLILTPAIGLNILSTQGLSSSTFNKLFYPLPLSMQNTGSDLYSINTGIDMDGLFTENWGYSADLEYAYLLNTNGASAWKSEAMFFYQWHTNSRILVGYKYIDGRDSNIHNSQLYPVVDFFWAW